MLYIHVYVWVHHRLVTVFLLLCAALLLCVMCSAVMGRECYGMSDVSGVPGSRSIDRNRLVPTEFRSHVCVCAYG